jgi:eukaryotic-like serine/threonine-protein kinase
MTFGAHGAMIANRYRLEALLGRGGYGEVWRALDTHRSHLVALKLILNRNRSATWREASLLTALKDEHILEVNNADVAVDLPYLDTALAACSLDAKSMPLGVEPGLAVDWMRRALRGLALCHRRGLLHRDIKPRNIFLSASGDAKLGDFGIAQVMDSAETADPEGDWHIRAPELFQGGRASVASDIYSSGVTLYALIAGRLPYEGIDLMPDLVAAVSASRYEPIRDAAPHVSQELADRIRKAMSLDPRQRFATASEFDNALSLRTRARRFTPIAPHESHERCWMTDGAGGSLHVCVRDSSLTGGRAVEVRHVSSGNRVKEHCGEVKARDLPKRLRKLFNALR